MTGHHTPYSREATLLSSMHLTSIVGCANFYSPLGKFFKFGHQCVLFNFKVGQLQTSLSISQPCFFPSNRNIWRKGGAFLSSDGTQHRLERLPEGDINCAVKSLTPGSCRVRLSQMLTEQLETQAEV